MGDAHWDWKTEKDGTLVATTKDVVPWHYFRRARPVWVKVGIQSKVLEGRLQLSVPPARRPWFTPTEPEAMGPMSWDAFEDALFALHTIHEFLSEQPYTGPPLHPPHGGLDLRSVAVDGELHGHQLALLAHEAAATAAELPRGLVVGDPRFVAPELWAGQEPDFASDIFALAAVFCYRRKPLGFGDGPIRPEDAITTLPRERLPADLPGERLSILLSLLDIESKNRLEAKEYLVERETRRR